ncbi:MAG: hypothetical protein IKR47_07825 [Lachnospiraceae bacterium]|nr:hypothetical protein [Parasporobacterium sp.]MBR4169619.1 hypothetical protein [Lachnospiraceae bacterium]
MTNLLVIKEQIIKYYARFEIFITPVLKFIVMLVSLIAINANVGFMGRLKNPAIVIILALLSSFLPINVMIVLAALVIVAHMYALSMACAAVVGLVFLIMFVLYFRFTPKEAIAVLLTPICFVLKVPYLVPLAMGFVGGPLSCISVACGTIAYFIMHNVKASAEQMTGTEGVENALSGFRYVIDTIIKDQTMILMTIAFCVTIVLVYLIRRLRINYSWYIALGVGAVINILIILVGAVATDADVSALGVIFGTVFSAALVLVMQFFIHNLDYSRTEYVQFEDDEYYYYVKAIPKISMEAPQNKVRRINPQQPSGGRRNYDMDE